MAHLRAKSGEPKKGGGGLRPQTCRNWEVGMLPTSAALPERKNAQLTRSAKSRRRKNVLVLFETYLESHQKRLSSFRWIGRQHRT